MTKFTGVSYVHPRELTKQQNADLRLGMAAVAAFWVAAHELHADQPHLLPHSRCIYAANAVVDILHALGQNNAVCFRSGLDLRMMRGGKVVRGRTIGHPAAQRDPLLWNAHLTVRIGNLLFDPSHAQMKAHWNNVPHYAAFLYKPVPGRMINFKDVRDEISLSEHIWREGDRMYKITFFKLARKVDLLTRRWRAAPDARLDRRTAVVRRTLELLERDR